MQCEDVSVAFSLEASKDFITDMKNITNENFRHVTTNGKVKLSCETTDGYRKIVTYLKTNKASTKILAKQ
jgi:hypothetical protein